MAVPKKRVSRTRKLLRRSQWKLEIRAQALEALSLAAQRTNKNNPDKSGVPSTPNQAEPN